MLKCLLFLAICLSLANAAHYAVLVAGSNNYYNYRHQADVAHSFQVLRKHGIPRENIIVMMFNDVAFDPQNPFPGQLFNRPDQPKNVNAGLIPDYQGVDVTAANFVKVITGDASAPGPVLKSGPNDDVFIFFSDHGGTGLIAFPSGPFLLSQDLNVALAKMNEKHMYRKLVFYLEACEAGSMFNNQLPNDMNIYVTTASSPDESSWGTYCSPTDVINGTHLNTCLGDLYSVSWLENADESNLSLETLLAQFTIVQQETNMSHVQQYGDLQFDSDPVAEFEGSQDVDVDVVLPPTTITKRSLLPIQQPKKRNNHKQDQRRSHTHNPVSKKRLYSKDIPSHRPVSKEISHSQPVDMFQATNAARARFLNPKSDHLTIDRKIARSHVVNNLDSKLHYLFNLYQRAQSDQLQQAAQALKTEIDTRAAIDTMFRTMAKLLVRKPFEPTDPLFHNQVEVFVTGKLANPANCNECCNKFFELIRKRCFAGLGGDNSGAWPDYALKYSRFVPNMCEYTQLSGYPFRDIETALNVACLRPLLN